MSQDHGVSKSVNGKTEGYWSESLNTQSKITCGYWYSSIFITSKRTRSFLMSLDGSVEEYLCHIQSRKPSASPYIHILMSGLSHKRKMIQEYSD